MLDSPAGLFPDDYNYGLPFIRGVNLRFIELFVYASFLKAIMKNNKFKSGYLKSYQLLLLLTVILIVYSLFLNTSILSVIVAIKWIFIWSLIYSIPKLLDNYDDWVFLFRIVFILVFIAFTSQILQLALGYSPSYLLGTNFNPMMGKEQMEVTKNGLDISRAYDIEVARPIGSSYIVLIGLSGAMFFQQYKTNIFHKSYLSLIIVVSFASIFITATRGWFIAFSVAIFLFLVYIQKIKRMARIGFITLILITFTLSIPFIQKQIVGSFNRISTLEAIIQGDLSAGGTSARVDYNLHLIKLWKESPILGWGFSEFYKENGNGHAGLANLLFSVGIIGYIVFIYFWYHLFFMPIFVNKKLSSLNPYKGSLIAFTLTFLIFFILNASSGQQFGIYLSFSGGIMAQIIYYSYSSFFIRMALDKETQIRAQGNDGNIKHYI